MIIMLSFGVQTMFIALNFQLISVQRPSVKVVYSPRTFEGSTRSEMRDRVVCAGPHLRCAPHKGAVFALRTQAPTLPCGPTANSQVQRHG